jgi:hypothetical protein
MATFGGSLAVVIGHIVRKPPGSRPTPGKWVGGRASVLNMLDVAVAHNEEEIEPEGLLDDYARKAVAVVWEFIHGRDTSQRDQASALI